MQCIEYSSNNSGGSWWLTEDDWLNLENAGWEVDWVKDINYYKGQTTFLGSTAMHARRYGLSEEQAIAEFERVTDQNAEDPGCSCCGQPHLFYWGDAEPRVLKVQAERAGLPELEG